MLPQNKRGKTELDDKVTKRLKIMSKMWQKNCTFA